MVWTSCAIGKEENEGLYGMGYRGTFGATSPKIQKMVLVHPLILNLMHGI
jgi:hypothetical protein